MNTDTDADEPHHGHDGEATQTGYDTEDLSLLEEINSTTVLNHLKYRFERGSYYTFCGDILVAVNPNKKVPLYTYEYHECYDESGQCHVPHVFWTARQTFLQLLHTSANQSILVTGESGAGKSETSKHVIRHVTYLSSLRMPASTCYTYLDDLHDRIVRVFPLLDSFGSAATGQNESASRFCKYLELHFAAEGYVHAATVHAWLCDVTRLIRRPTGEEGNFHIFYCLFAGLTDEQKAEYKLQDPDLYRILRCDSDRKLWERLSIKRLQELYRNWISMMCILGLTKEDVSVCIAVLSAILNLTNILFVETNDGLKIAEMQYLTAAASLLSTDPTRLMTSLTCNSLVIRGEKVVHTKTQFSAEIERDQLAKALYKGLFDWIVQKINAHLNNPFINRFDSATMTIFDLPGFADLQQNDYEQLCINAVSERTQHYVNDVIFRRENAECRREGVTVPDVSFRNNDAATQLLFREPDGLLSANTMYHITQIAQSESLAANAMNHIAQIAPSETPPTQPKAITDVYDPEDDSDGMFSIRHYRGWVRYRFDDDRDMPGTGSGHQPFCCTADLINCVKASSNGRIAGLILDNNDGFAKREGLGDVKSDTYTGTARTTALQRSLDEAFMKAADGRPWFIKCIRPNSDGSPDGFEESLVMDQVESENLAAIAETRRDGYSVSLTPREFMGRFRDISYSLERNLDPTMVCVETILKDAGINDFVIGETKVFLRHWQEPYLVELVNAVKNDRPVPRTPSSSDVHTDVTDVRSAVTSEAYCDVIDEHEQQQQQQEEGASNSSQRFGRPEASELISEWMRKTENQPPDVTLPPYRPSLSEPQIRELNERRILDPRWWDRFQVIPRDHSSSSGAFQTVFKVFKVLCYILLFVVVLASGVVNKICLLIMTSSIPKDNLPECDWPTKTMLILSMCFPYAQWFLMYSAKSLFGSSTWPSLSLLSAVLFFELLHTCGLCLLVFRVLPHLDMLRCFIVLGSLYLIPAALKTVFEGRDIASRPARKCAALTLNIGAFLIQFVSMFGCIILNISYSQEEKDSLISRVVNTGVTSVISRSEVKGDNSTIMWELPISLLLISLAYWENYADGDYVIFGKTLKFKQWKRHLHHSRARVYIFASIWKAVWVIVLAMLLQTDFKFNLDFSANSATASANVTPGVNTINTTSSPNLFDMSPRTVKHFEKYGVLYLQVLSNLAMTYFGSIACKMCMQIVGFSLPLVLVTPVSIAVVMLQSMYKVIPTGVYVMVTFDMEDKAWILHLAWLGILWLSEMFITSHIWFPNNGRMEKIDRLFVTPLKYGILTDQSLILRRRRNDHDSSLNPDDDGLSSVHTLDSCGTESTSKSDDVVPQIYACATMWHETRAEMSNLLKSMFRMDIDHSGRYLAQKFYKIRDPDYYEFEAHIFFDDAMELSTEGHIAPNSFVADFLECVDDALSSVHERQISLGPPMGSPTPYGGRLTWKLPGGTRLVVHLKDKHKIRHKKRWSQVMYMYYLLGYRIFAQPENLLKKNLLDHDVADMTCQRVTLTDAQLRRRRKAAHFTRSVIFNYVTDDVHTQAENTYILTLDGDVDFHPDAVRLLVDRLKTNKKVGAACGRIHPIGSGPLLWYQQFEYAIGHWLQKATEHVFGCVLCAPGCFSLFRGSALMDDNVAKTYATRATEAGHYVQFDQGEDRWLSTLLLQQGYRIDYCAASDALTHAPETFSEFFNQRRRWGPSTLANVVDLLGKWKETIKINDNISTLYILYQFCMMVSTILGPATILLMMAGAFTVVFKTGVLASYALAIVPAVLFMLVCIYGKSSLQMTLASIMSACYAIIMTIVLVGTIGQAVDGGLTSPNVVFLVMIVFIFFISALMHPEEFSCVIPGALYFICLPTGYLLLTIYYLCNMHVVSWGTREGPDRKSREEIEDEKEASEERQLKHENKKGFLGFIGFNAFMREMREFSRQLRNSETKSEKSKTDILLQELIKEIRIGRNETVKESIGSNTTVTETECQTESLTDVKIDAPRKCSNISDDTSDQSWLLSDTYDNISWLQSRQLERVPIKRLSEKESIFWKQLISKYLQPINEDKTHQLKVASDLKNLRNNVVFGFFMSSALWVALSMQLQILQEELKGIIFFKIPRWDSNEDLTFEPLGLIFLIFFATILFVQFVGMFAHRWGTVLHMLSITEISCGKTFTEKDKVRDIITKAMDLQRLCNIENEAIPDYEEPLPDYDDSDEEDTLEVSSSTTMPTGDSVSMTSGGGPPAYQSAVTPPAVVKRRRNRLNIFNKKGHSTGSALRKAFEKRFRLERQEHVITESTHV